MSDKWLNTIVGAMLGLGMLGLLLYMFIGLVVVWRQVF